MFELIIAYWPDDFFLNIKKQIVSYVEEGQDKPRPCISVLCRNSPDAFRAEDTVRHNVSYKAVLFRNTSSDTILF